MALPKSVIDKVPKYCSGKGYSFHCGKSAVDEDDCLSYCTPDSFSFALESHAEFKCLTKQ